jgi:hypothetical protein
VDGWEHILDRERTMSGEKLAENLTSQKHEREREAYRQWLVEKENSDDLLRQDQPPHRPEIGGASSRLTLEQQEQMERLANKGMSRTWATAEVLGVGLKEF